MSKFYSIRVIEADNLEEAISKMQDGDAAFCDEDPLCDAVLTREQLLDNLRANIISKRRRY